MYPFGLLSVNITLFDLWIGIALHVNKHPHIKLYRMAIQIYLTVKFYMHNSANICA